MTPQDRRTFIKAAAASAAAVAFSRVATPQPTAAATGSVTTNDGITLRYEEAGSGKPLVCIPGWSQTAAQFKYQLSGLSDRYRVIAVDMRVDQEANAAIRYGLDGCDDLLGQRRELGVHHQHAVGAREDADGSAIAVERVEVVRDLVDLDLHLTHVRRLGAD